MFCSHDCYILFCLVHILLFLYLDLGEMHVLYVMGFLLYITCELTPFFL